MHDNGFEVRHEENLREHYAMTLAGWCANLDAHWDEAVAEVGEGTARVWRLYMAGSRLGFERNVVQLHQVLGVKLGADGPGRDAAAARTGSRWPRCPRPARPAGAAQPARRPGWPGARAAGASGRPCATAPAGPHGGEWRHGNSAARAGRPGP